MTGGCLCGSIRYELTASPQVSIVCYCSQCQHITGTGHAPQLGVSRSHVSMKKGSPKSYDLVADSGNKVTSAFCGTCGAPLFKTSSGYPDMVFFHAGSLDAPASYAPKAAVWVKSRQPWDPLRADLPVQG
jgi:hypothetical protein